MDIEQQLEDEKRATQHLSKRIDALSEQLRALTKTWRKDADLHYSRSEMWRIRDCHESASMCQAKAVSIENSIRDLEQIIRNNKL